MKFRRFVAILCALVVVLSLTVMPASAASSKKMNSTKGTTKTATVTLTNKSKSATVRISSCYSGSAITVKMYSSSGKYIWGESRAVSFNSHRDFYLGCDYSVYKIKTSTYVSNRAMNVTLYCLSNCSVK